MTAAHLTLMVITDGRQQCLERTLASFVEAVDQAKVHSRIIVNDCPDPDYSRWIQDTYHFDLQLDSAHKRGFAGAIQAGWNSLPPLTQFVLHLEDDFMFNRFVPVDELEEVLETHPELAQIALRRQAVNHLEAQAGGVIEMHPQEYTEVTDLNYPRRQWLEHRLFFTTNPSVYPIATTRQGWPQVEGSERAFSTVLFDDPTRKVAFWGRRADPPWVHHIGDVRVGTGY